MDNKTVFVRTSKGEDEVHSRTTHLPGDIKRTLLMVDGTATYGEISKRAAPSLRPGLEAMLQELQKDGYITDKGKAGISPKAPVPPPKMSVPPPKMSVPPKMVTPHKVQSADKEAADLDFMSGFGAPSKVPESEKSKATAASDKLKAESEERAMEDIQVEAAKFQAQQEAEGILRKAEQEAARIREEAEREKQRAAAEIHAREEAARRAREEAEATRLKVEQEVKARLEAEAKALQQVEAARKKAEQEAAIAHETAERIAQQEREAARAREEAARRVKEEAEAARLKAEQAVKARLEAETRALQQAEAARKKAEHDAAIAQETAERLVRQERETARAREDAEARARRDAAKHTEVPAAAKPDTFTFDAFQVDEAQHSAKPHEVDHAPEKKASPEHEAASAAKPDTFAFGAFHVDEQPSVKPQQAEQPVKKAASVEPAHAAKREKFSFDTFKIEIPEAPAVSPTKEKTSAAQHPDDAARAARHPETRQPEQQEASTSAAGKSSSGKPTEEEIPRATQERIETEKRIAEEALAAKKHAEEQAKARADAEKRVAEAARAEVEQAASKARFAVDGAQSSAKPAPVVRVRRKPFSLGKLVGFFFKLGLSLLVLLIGVLFAAPYVLPTRDYVPQIEKFLSEKLHQPVHVGRLSGRILPLPRLELGEIYVGKVKQVEVEQVLVNFAITGLIIDAKPIDSIELQGIKVSGAALQNVSVWLQQVAGDSQYPVARIVISHGTVDADAVKLTGVEGSLDFNKIGEFTSASFRSNDGKYLLGITAPLGNKPQVAITVRNSALPLLPNWSFDELTAKGVLSNNDMSINEFDARIADGILQGSANINWRSGWVAQGNIVAKTISMQRLNRLLEGNVEGSARFKMTSIDLAGLSDSATMEGTFTAKKGLISGMDIIETARMRSREHLPGGRTHFDELSGSVAYAGNAIHFKQVKVTTDVLNAVAMLDVEKQQISGSIVARLTLQEAMKPVNLQIGGTTDTPTLRFVP